MAQVRSLKRHADDDFQNAHRLSKRLHTLNLDNNQTTHSVSLPPRPPTPPAPAVPPPQPSVPASPRPPTTTSKPDDYMPIDPTPHKVYIHDLDAELASVSPSPSETGQLIFLPDIEKHLQAIPRNLLQRPQEPRNDQLVLYELPKSLTVPEERDSVRRAILDARARAREKVLGVTSQLLEEEEKRRKFRVAHELNYMSANGGGDTRPRLPEDERQRDGEQKANGSWKGSITSNGSWDVGPKDVDMDDAVYDEDGPADADSMELG